MNRRRPQLLVLTQHYRPEPNFITADVAEAVTDTYDVTVVTAHPNYPEGRFYRGVTAWRPGRSVENGVTVWRLPMYAYHGRSQLKRFLSYMSFALAAAVWSPFAVVKPRVVWVYHGPFTAGLAAIWFRLIGARVVFTCADLWPESFLAAKVAGPGMVMRLMFAYSRAINRIADLLICSTRGTMQRYAADGIPGSALCYVPVWVEGIPEDAGLPSSSEAAPVNLVYAGNLGPAQRLETVIRAAAKLCQEQVAVQFDIYGTGASEADLRQLALDTGAINVTFHGRVPPAEAFARASSGLAQIVCLQPTPLFAMTLPSKLSFSFAAAAPILYGLVGESARLVAESGGGIPFDADDPDSLVAAVRQLLALPPPTRVAMRSSLRKYYEDNFNRTTLVGRYKEIFDGFALMAASRVGGRLAEKPLERCPAGIEITKEDV